MSTKAKSSVSPSSKKHSFQIGKAYLVRTVTLYYTGLLKAITESDLVLESAAWIPDTGRFYNCLKESKIQECEPFVNDVIISRGAIIDATIWSGSLPADQK